MKFFNRQTGNLGETLAVAHLKKNHYQIIEANFHNRFGEIDIIALTPDKQTLVFIEVKTKTGNYFGSPEEMINSHKLHQVYRLGQIYLQGKPVYQNLSTRIDVIAIVLNPNQSLNSLTHHQAII
jgi:putative endonuclease